jgi:hypothetical protein
LIALLVPLRAPQARPTPGVPKKDAAASCGMAAADVAEETLDWLTNQATLASDQAMASTVLQ